MRKGSASATFTSSENLSSYVPNYFAFGYFYTDNNKGTLETPDGLTNFEMWLESPSENIIDGSLKIGSNILYSLPNSCSILLTNETIGGTDRREFKVDAFVDVAPSILSLGTSTLTTKVTEKGLKGFNQYVKENSGILRNRGKDGMKQVGELYQNNKKVLESLESLDKVDQIKEVGSNTKKEFEKEQKR